MRLRSGFTLLELTMVLAVSGLMLGFVMNMAQSKTTGPDECASTKTQMIAIRGAIEVFARKNDRLPLPAARNVAPENITYGRESSGANIDAAAGVSFGALPFQALGLPTSYAGDCWGNKYTYVVTTALTTSAASGGFLDTLVTGNITLKDGSGNTINALTAYAIISHGEDALGAAKLGYTAANPTHGWCTGAATLKYTNCLATAAVLADGTFNNGKDAGAAYYDDIIVAAAKPSILSTATSNAYCWGDNTNGQLGDSTTTQRNIPTLVSGGIQFSQISNGSQFTCGLDITGKAYCWGDNSFFRYKGTAGGDTTPLAISPAQTFSEIQAGEVNTLALDTTGKAWCWGYNGNICGTGLGVGILLTPTLVAGGLTFAHISNGYEYGCGVTTAGAGYCWGWNNYTGGRLGDGSVLDSGVPVPVSGGLTFKKIVAGVNHTCGLTITGAAYCWGDNAYGELGDGTGGLTDSNVPVAVSGGLFFKDIALGAASVCGLTTTGAAYCWGDNSYGQAGRNYTAPYYHDAPVLVNGGYTFIKLTNAYFTYCGETADYKTYCWGRNNVGQLGDNSTTQRLVPTLITGAWPLVFGSVANTGLGWGHQCALQPLPPVAWGYNGWGGIGDGTSTDRNAPVFMTMPTGANYFASIWEYPTNRCALSDLGNAYCWGYNVYGSIGNNTTGANELSAKAVTMPGGLTFTSMAPGAYGTCAIASNNVPYCWGSGYYLPRVTSSTVPAIQPLPPVTVTQIQSVSGGSCYVGSNGQAYAGGTSWAAPSLVAPLPGGVASVTKVACGFPWSARVCIIGNDGQVYCKGAADVYNTIGDGSVGVSRANLVAVTKPSDPPVSDATYHSFTDVSIGDVGGGNSGVCALADNSQIYCWGHGLSGMLGNGAAATTYVPTKVSLPTGVTGWRNVYVGVSIVTALGDDGNYYYWGWYNGYSGGYVYSPTKIPLPVGALGYRSLSGRSGTVY